VTAAPATIRTRSRLRGAAGWAVSLSIAFGLIVLGELSVTMQAIQSTIAARESAWLAGAIAVASLGFVLLMGGAIHLAIRGRGEDSATLAEVK
jgi:hypothetical protein